MSHSVIFYLDNKKQNIISTCDVTLDLLNEAIKSNTNIEYINFIKEKINEISQKKSIALSQPDTTTNINVFKNLSTLVKETTNIVSTLSNAEFFEKKYNDNKNEIKNLISIYGTIAISGIESLEKKNISISKESLIDEIELIRNKKMHEEKIENGIKELFNLIDLQKFNNNDLNYELKNIVRNFSTPQEFSDAAAFIASKKVELVKIEMIKEKIINGLNISGYKKFNLISTKLNESSIIVQVYKARNDKGNEIEISISGDGSIKYKLGNYVGHACEQTTDRLLQYLKSQNIFVNHVVITRNIDNSRPMYMQAKLKRSL